jgi:contractile injection system tube protein
MRLEKAVLTPLGSGEPIPVLFNPEEYTLNRSATFASAVVPGLSAPLLQFVSGGEQTLEMELFLDTYEEHRSGSRVLASAGQDVRVFTRQITGLMEIDPTTHAPPVLLFAWGSLTFQCVLARVTSRFVMFLADGTPVRARLQVSFTEFRNADTEAREVKRETADYTRIHTLLSGQSLSDVAAQIYGDPGAWRPIAVANGIEDARAVTAGTQLLLPRLPFRDPDTGAVLT